MLQTFHRGIRDLKIALWLAENSYGPAYDLLGARNATIAWQIETDELRGDDVVLDRYAKPVSVTVDLEQASVDLTAIDLFVGGTLVYNADYYDLSIKEGDEVPYLTIAGRVVGSGGTSDLQFLVPKAKIAGNLQLQAQLDQYMLPQAQFQGVHEGDTNGMIRFRHFTALTALEIPLRTTTGGF